MPTIIDDPYQQCEDGVVAKLRTLTSYFSPSMPWQISDDDAVLQRGADHFVIYRPGAFPSEPVTGRIKDMEWHITADVYVRYADYKTSWAKYRRLRNALLHTLLSDPSLDGTYNVYSVNVQSTETASYFRFEDNESLKPNFIIQTLDISVKQRVKFDEE